MDADQLQVTSSEGIVTLSGQVDSWIEQVYPDIGKCGIDLDVAYDTEHSRWKVFLKKDNKSLETFLEAGDAELCMEGRQCVCLGIEISQLKDNIEKQIWVTHI